MTHLPKRLCPIFQVSNVTGVGLDLVRTFLNLLPSSEGDGDKFAADQPLEVIPIDQNHGELTF